MLWCNTTLLLLTPPSACLAAHKKNPAGQRPNGENMKLKVTWLADGAIRLIC